MSESKCQVNSNQIEPCAVLAKALEHDAEYTTRKGLLIYKIESPRII
ncbi:DNA ligase domain protein [Escherichia coli 2-316-03_S3_C1]|nr:DNA ligase domain protein [Escherichia coli 2-316-03_S3_C1]